MQYANQIIGFFKGFNGIDLLDLSLAALLIYFVYRTVKGSAAFNIIIGIGLVYLVYAISNKLDMRILSNILDKIVQVGLVGLIIVFQPEIRKFLSNIARNSPIGKNGILSKFLQSSAIKNYATEEDTVLQLSKALKYFVENKLGALLVVVRGSQIEFDTNSSVQVRGLVTSKLLECIFEKNSPLHDGAVVIDKNEIVAARVVLPITDNTNLPSRVGLRHRAAVGATEHSDVFVIIVSEETGTISYAEDGKLFQNATIDVIKKKLFSVLIG
jgi:diadenylate cyclase